MTCRYPDSVYIAEDEDHLEILLRAASLGCCQNSAHQHQILRLWALAHDLKAVLS